LTGVAGISLLVVTLLGTDGVMLHAVSRQAQRLRQLESAQKSALTRDALLSLQVSLSAVSTRTVALENRIHLLTRDVATLSARPWGDPDLLAQVGALRQAQRTMSLRVTGLQARVFTPVTPAPVPLTRATDRSILPPRKTRSDVVHSAPFVLTGTERRGTEVLAGVAPRGFTRLSQVQLLVPGASFRGWELIEADQHRARFRSGHRRLILRCVP
jgi:hypothetical protein